MLNALDKTFKVIQAVNDSITEGIFSAPAPKTNNFLAFFCVIKNVFIKQKLKKKSFKNALG